MFLNIYWYVCGCFNSDPSHDPNSTEQHLPGSVDTAREPTEARHMMTTLHNDAPNPSATTDPNGKSQTHDLSLRQQPEGDSDPELLNTTASASTQPTTHPGNRTRGDETNIRARVGIQ